MQFQASTKLATAHSPQVVTVLVDNSGSMQGDKAKQASAGIRDLIISMQSGNLGSRGCRYFINLAKFGTQTTALARAAAPEEVPLSHVQFDGSSGSTEMASALTWAHEAVCASLEKCRKQVAGYREEHAPTPLVVILSDGANTGPDVGEAAKILKSVRIADTAIDVVAVGIGMEERDYQVMQSIASRPALAANIDPNGLSQFLAQVGATVVAGKPPEHFTAVRSL